jgi:hypothetical protein
VDVEDKQRGGDYGRWRINRRDFLKAADMAATAVAVGGIPPPLLGDQRRLAKFPKKTEFRLLGSRNTVTKRFAKKGRKIKMKTLKIVLISTFLIGLFIMMAFAAGDPAKGKVLFNDPKLGGGTAGISCNTCHPDGKGLEKAGGREDLAQFINKCIVNALKGKGIDPNSADMADLIAYIKSLQMK